MLDSSFIGLKTKENIAEKMFEAFQAYAQIALPSRVIPDKIGNIDKDKLKDLRELLQSAKKGMKPSLVK